MSLDAAGVPRLLVYVGAMILGVVSCVRCQERPLREVRTLASHRAPSSPAQRAVRVEGEVRDGPLVRSRLGRSCAAWEGAVHVTTKERSSKTTRTVVTRSCAEGGGEITIAAAGTALRVPAFELGLVADSVRREERALEDVPGLRCKASATNPVSVRYVETCLQPGDHAIAYGCRDGSALQRCGDGVDGVFSPTERDRFADPRLTLAWEGVLGAAGLAIVAFLLIGPLGRRAVDARRGDG
jgi:hypothetical protein